MARATSQRLTLRGRQSVHPKESNPKMLILERQMSPSLFTGMNMRQVKPEISPLPHAGIRYVREWHVPHAIAI